MAADWSPPLHSYRDASDEFSDVDGDSDEGRMAALDLEEEARPVLRHGECKQVKKGEDLVLVEEAFKLGGRDVSCFCVSFRSTTAERRWGIFDYVYFRMLKCSFGGWTYLFLGSIGLQCCHQWRTSFAKRGGSRKRLALRRTCKQPPLNVESNVGLITSFSELLNLK